MKKHNILALLLAFTLTAGLTAGCGSNGNPSSGGGNSESGQNEQTSENAEETPAADTAQNLDTLQNTVGPGDAAEEVSEVPAETAEEENGETAEEGGMSIGTAGQGSGILIEDVPYVMIYNPNVYDEKSALKNIVTSLTTGDLSKQILVPMARADGLEEEFDYPVMVSQAEINQGFEVEKGLAGDQDMHKAGELDPVYSEGMTHEFFRFGDDGVSRVRTTFECVYEGEKCYMWAFEESISREDAQILGEEFDNRIYDMDTEMFGPARFMDNGGKLNVLFYPMNSRLAGFFCKGDLVSEADVPSLEYAEAAGFNVGHAIINVNSNMVKLDLDYIKSTLAHEFQHLIVGSDFFASENTPYMRTWLNEAMSAYAEDYVYPGSKILNGFNWNMYASNNYRIGQSLYNFDTSNDRYIGAYGAVYLFSKYLTEHSDNDVYKVLHNYWRASDSETLSEAEALYNSVTDSFREEIAGKYSYPELVEARFDTPEDEWMSKLVLDYFIETMDLGFSQLSDRAIQVRYMMLYKEINKQRIQGGGRLVIATERRSYEIPADADEGLIYIGLDDHFQVIPDKIIVK